LFGKIKYKHINTKMIALFAAISVASVFLYGCEYSDVDEYLDILEMTDYEYEDSSSVYDDEAVLSDLEATEESETIVDDSVASGLSIEKEKPADSDFTSFYKKFFDTDVDTEVKRVRDEAGLTDENLEKVKKQQVGNYAFDKLTDAGKNLYAELYLIIINESKEVYVSATSEYAIDLVFNYLMIDHPEIFWVEGYTFVKHTVGDVVDKIAFTGEYTYDLKEVERRQKKIDECVNQCLANAPSSDDDYYAIKYVYEYLIANTDYVSDAPDNQNICSVFIGKESVCSGYSKATQYLLNKMGIKCTLVSGTVDTRDGKDAKHSWNLVLCNDKYYYMDTTWGDASYQTTSGETGDEMKLPRVNYDYLCVTTKSIETNHRLSDIIALPECNSMTDNYYVREDEYFKSDELDLVKDLFDRRYNDGSDSVTIKCASNDIYDSLFNKLITEKGVFSYLQGDTKTVSYTVFEETNTIIFWL